MRKLKIGIIGAGNIAGSHINALMGIEEVEIIAVADIDSEKAEVLASKCGAGATKDYNEIITDETVEAVFILTPPNRHREPFLEAAMAKKAIFCEKPLAHRLEDAEAVVAAVGENDTFCQVGFVLRYNPIWKGLHDVAAEGRIGELKSIWNTRTMPWNPQDWHRDPKIGGLLQDFNPHDIDWIWWTSKEPKLKSACGFCQTLSEDSQCEDSLSVTMHFDNGVVANHNSSWAIHQQILDIVLVGTEGTASIHADNRQVDEIYLFNKNRKRSSISLRRDVNMLMEEDRDFVMRVLNGRKPSVSAETATESLKILLEIQKSIKKV